MSAGGSGRAGRRQAPGSCRWRMPHRAGAELCSSSERCSGGGRQGRQDAHRMWRQVPASHSTAAASSPFSQLFMCSMIARWLSSMVRMTKDATVPASARKGCAGSPALQGRGQERGRGRGRLGQQK